MAEIPPVVWLMGTFTSFVAAVLLVRAYVFHRAAMLLSSAAGFVALAIGNLLLFLDDMVFLESDLLMFRQRPVLIAFTVLLWGFALD